MLIKSSLRSNYIVEEKEQLQRAYIKLEMPKKKVKVTYNKETKEKMSEKLQENQRKKYSKRNKKQKKTKQMKVKEKASWGERAKRKFEKV